VPEAIAGGPPFASLRAVEQRSRRCQRRWRREQHRPWHGDRLMGRVPGV